MGLIVLICIIAVVISILIFIITTYNNLIKLKNKIKNSWAHVDAQLQRRFDLIPNLVEIAKNHSKCENELLENVSSIRKQYTNANTNSEKLAMDRQLTLQLQSLYSVFEKHPKLKMDVQFLKMQSALAEIEEDISYARQFYNDAVTIYNNKLMAFPNNIIASMFNFKEEELFNAEKCAEKAPKIRYKKVHSCPVCGGAVTNDNDTCEFCGCALY